MLTRLLRGLRAGSSFGGVELFALRIESHAVNVCSVRAGERHVETAGAATIEGCVAEKNAALARDALECKFEDNVFVAFVEDEPSVGAGLRGSGDGAVFGAPFCGAEGVPSGEARAVERAERGGWRVGAQRKEEAEEGYSGQNHGAGAFRHGRSHFRRRLGRFLLCRKMARQDGVPRILFAAQNGACLHGCHLARHWQLAEPTITAAGSEITYAWPARSTNPFERLVIGEYRKLS